MFDFRVGIDIVEIAEFKDQLSKTSNQLLNKVFHHEEIKDRDLVSIAGLFAAKESIIKTGLIETGEWLKLKFTHSISERPQVIIVGDGYVKGLDITISHTKTIAVAVSVRLFQ